MIRLKEPTEARARFGHPLAWLLLFLCWTALYLPGLGTAEFRHEEGRRAIPAREMVESGDYVKPTIFGRTYLSKPPLYFWTIALFAQGTGGVNELSTRLPAALATLLTVLCIYFFGRKLFDEATGFAAGLMFLLSLGVFEKGALGELEASLCLYTFAATVLLWLGRAALGGRTIGCALLVAAAMLTKGPVVLLFYLPAGVAIAAVRREPRFLVSARLWLPVLAGICALGAWVFLLSGRVDLEDALAHWQGELSRANDNALALYLGDRLRFFSDLFVDFFPDSLLCLFGLVGRRSRVQLGRGGRFLLLAFLLSLGLLALQPGVRGRFAYPALPWCTLLAARVLVLGLERRLRLGLALKLMGGLVALAGTGLLVGSLVLLFRPIEGVGPFGAEGYLGMLLLAVVLFRLVRELRREPGVGLPVAVAFVLALGRVTILTEIEPQLRVGLPRHEAARLVDTLVPPGESIDLRFWAGFNELAYVGHPLLYRELDSPLGPEEHVLVLARDEERFQKEHEEDFEVLGELTLRRSAPFRLLRRADGASGD